MCSLITPCGLAKLCFSHGSHRRRPMYPRVVLEGPMCTGVYRPRTCLYRFVSTAPGDTLRYTFVSGRWMACHNHAMNAQPLILVVDDDREIRTLLSEYLAGNGFRTAEAADGAAMWKALDATRIDLIVLDLMMPGEDGLQLCRNLRAKSNLPVIMLTARGQPIDRIVGLEMGADDYLAKPFEPRELLARIRSVLRRTEAMPPNLESAEATRMRFA